MKKLVVALPLSLITLSAFAFPNIPEYNGTIATAPISIVNAQNNQIWSELLTLQTNVTNTTPGHFQVFATGSSNPVRVQNDNLQPGYRHNSEAFTVGFDYHTDHAIYGLAAGRNMGALTYVQNNGSVSLDENMLSIFGGYKLHHIYGAAIATYGNIDASNINHNIGSQTFVGETTGDQVDLNGTLGYNFALADKKLHTGPVLNADYQDTRIKGFAESPTNTGVITTPVQYGDQDNDTLTGGAGWQINYHTQYNTTELIPFLQTTYDHQFLNTQRNVKIGMGVFSSGTTSYIPYDVSDSNFVNVKGGVQAIFNTGVDLTFAVDSVLGQKTVDSENFVLSASVPVG